MSTCVHVRVSVCVCTCVCVCVQETKYTYVLPNSVGTVEDYREVGW